jgi:hypothetical protein
MAKIKYADFNDYYENDKKFFIRLFKEELHKPQSKIYFADGSTYHVTKAGSRYWHYYDFDGNSLGFKGELVSGKTYWYCSLNQETYENAADFWNIAHFLTE